MNERTRIEFLVERDGLPKAIEWVHRTMLIYRCAVLNKTHFANTTRYRRHFILAYYEFKKWLRSHSTC